MPCHSRECRCTLCWSIRKASGTSKVASTSLTLSLSEKPGFALKLNVSEVDATFEVPLAFLMDQNNVQRHSRDWQGMTRHYYAFTFGERYIWGVTAGILRNLHERIYR